MLLECKFCGSTDVVKNSFSRNGKQMYRCEECFGRFCNPNSPPNMKTNYDAFHFILLWGKRGYSTRKIQRSLEAMHDVKLSHVAVWDIIKKFPVVNLQKVDKGYVLVYQVDEVTQDARYINSLGETMIPSFDLSSFFPDLTIK